MKQGRDARQLVTIAILSAKEKHFDRLGLAFSQGARDLLSELDPAAVLFGHVPPEGLAGIRPTISISRPLRAGGGFALAESYMDARVETGHFSKPSAQLGDQTVLAVLVSLSVSHMINDTMQSLVPAVYPVLKTSFSLNFSQIGLITLAFQITASFLQPIVGLVTDKTPRHYSLAVGMAFSLIGLIMLSRAPNFYVVILSASLIGIGSAVFHPEASRIARASGRRKFGIGFGAAPCCLCRRTARPARDRVVCAFGIRRHDRAGRDWSLV
jgi:hypothetical protein